MADVVTIEFDGAFGGLVEALQEFGKRALATTRRTHDGDTLAGGDGEVQTLIQVGQIPGVAEGEILDVDTAVAFAFAVGESRVGLARRVHDIAQALDGDGRLLELLPQADQLEHGLRKAAREHLKGDQHADGEAGLLHHHPGAGAKDGEREQLFEGMGDGLVGVGELPGLEARVQVGGEIAAEAVVELGLHLQRLDGFQAGDVFGHERLVAGSQQELVVEALAKPGCDDKAQDSDGGEYCKGDERELPGVPEHDGQKHAHEGQVEHQRDGGAGEKFADGFDALQARDQHAGGPLFEVARGQAKQVLEDLQAQHGIDAVAGVQDEILAHPSHDGSKQHEYGQANANDGQGVEGVVDDDFVDDGLCEQRGGKRHQLNRGRGDEDIAKDFFVLEQLGDEPAEAEARRGGAFRIGIDKWLVLECRLQHLPGVARFEFAQGHNGVVRRTLFEEGDAAGFLAHHQSEAWRAAACGARAGECRFVSQRMQHDDERRRQLRKPVRGQALPCRAQAQSIGRAHDAVQIVRRRELAAEKLLVKRDAIDLA